MPTTQPADPDDPTAMALPVLHDIVRMSDGQEAEVVGRSFGEERCSYYAVRDDSGQVRKVHVSEIVGYPEHQPLAVESESALSQCTPNWRSLLDRGADAMRAAMDQHGMIHDDDRAKAAWDASYWPSSINRNTLERALLAHVTPHRVIRGMECECGVLLTESSRATWSEYEAAHAAHLTSVVLRHVMGDSL